MVLEHVAGTENVFDSQTAAFKSGWNACFGGQLILGRRQNAKNIPQFSPQIEPPLA